MRLWCEVYTPAGERLGTINLISATVMRKLDGIGRIDLRVGATEPRAMDLLQTRRRAHVYSETTEGKRLAGRGILKRKITTGASTVGAAWTADEESAELLDTNTLRDLAYMDQDISAIAGSLISRVDGWTLQIETGLGSTSRRFDGATIFAALRELVTGAGLHMRAKRDAKIIQAGALGKDTGIRAMNVGSGHPALSGNHDIALIETITHTHEGGKIVNWIEPVWGTGNAVITLRRSTKYMPYAIQQMTGNDGRLVYFLRDEASIAQYGQVQEVLAYSGTIPITDETTSLRPAADYLYDWAVAQLKRKRAPREAYSISLRKAALDVLPGDRVRVAYKGTVERQGVAYYLEINDMFWVTGTTESYTAQGMQATWDISSVDEALGDEMDEAAAAIAGSIKAQTNSRKVKQLATNAAIYSTTGTISYALPLVIGFFVARDVVEIGRGIVTVTRAAITGAHGFWVTVDGVEVAGRVLDLMIDGLQAVIDITDYFNVVQGNHQVIVHCEPGPSGNVTVEVKIVEVGISV